MSVPPPSKMRGMTALVSMLITVITVLMFLGSFFFFLYMVSGSR